MDSLGFIDGRLMPPREGEVHVEFDLAKSGDESRWPSLAPYDLILFAEVIEHLYTAPLQTLRMLRVLLKSGGAIIIQTPNAAALSRRFWLLMGRNPFEPIRDDLHQAGHYREYTVSELRALCEQAGLQITAVEQRNYFVTGSAKNRLLVTLDPITPPTLRQGITVVATH
jgi:2-polyprenyl-3-methyl-5-hydroxy-6-metoxy-1,4-benzoquinol methylase